MLPEEDVAPSSKQNPSVLIDRWEQKLNTSKWARVRFKVVRTYKHEGEGEEKNRTIRLHGEAVMEQHAHWLTVWEGDEQHPSEHDGPALTIEFEGQTIRERLWQPTLQQYRTLVYPAPTPFGTKDTEYETGCEIGTLLLTWLGGSDIAASIVDKMRSATPLRDDPDSPNAQWQCFAQIGTPDFDAEINESYQRNDYYYLDGEGFLKQWKTILKRVRPNSRLRIVQTRDYDFGFSNEVPDRPRPQAPAATEPASSN